MSANIDPVRGEAGGSALPGMLLALSILVALIVTLVSLNVENNREHLAYAYARHFKLHSEDDCPRQLGNAFWFRCASEVRRIRAAGSP
jgi:hypothetical protein